MPTWLKAQQKEHFPWSCICVRRAVPGVMLEQTCQLRGPWMKEWIISRRNLFWVSMYAGVFQSPLCYKPPHLAAYTVSIHMTMVAYHLVEGKWRGSGKSRPLANIESLIHLIWMAETDVFTSWWWDLVISSIVKTVKLLTLWGNSIITTAYASLVYFNKYYTHCGLTEPCYVEGRI